MAGKIKITKDGPYAVSGKLPLGTEIVVSDDKGFSVDYKKGKEFQVSEHYDLCRCGNSKHKPYCDGSHLATKFKGTETASKKSYNDTAGKIIGKDFDLMDRTDLCFGVGFCHSKKGDVWDLVEKSNSKEVKDQAIKMACNCTSGRLVPINKETGKPIENKYIPSISLIEEPARKASGPLWVKGGVEIESADGKLYEVRNRVTLCRCGKSNNKPFCDGEHVSVRFNDGDESVSKKKK